MAIYSTRSVRIFSYNTIQTLRPETKLWVKIAATTGDSLPFQGVDSDRSFAYLSCPFSDPKRLK